MSKKNRKFKLLLLVFLIVNCISCHNNNIEEAEDAYNRGDYSLCIELLNDVDDKTAHLEFISGMSYLQMSYFLKAVDHFTKSVKSAPFDTLSYFYRALAYDSLGYNIRALNDYEKVLEIDPYFMEAYSKKAAIYERSNDFSHALEVYNIALKIDSNNCILIN
jgi:Tfp pilus assembly protein PilF